MKEQEIQKVYDTIKAPDESVNRLTEKLEDDTYKKTKTTLLPKRYYKKAAFITAMLIFCIIFLATPASARLLEYGQNLLAYLGFYEKDDTNLESYMQEEKITSDKLSSTNTEFSISEIVYSNNTVITLLTVTNPDLNFTSDYKFSGLRIFYELKNGETPVERKYTLDLDNSPYGMSSYSFREVDISNHSISYILSFDLGCKAESLKEISLVFEGFGEAYLDEIEADTYLEKYKNYSDSKWTISWVPQETKEGNIINIDKEITFTPPYTNEPTTWIINNVILTPFSLECNVNYDNQLSGEFIDAILWKDGSVTNLKECGEEFGFNYSENSENFSTQKETIIFKKLIDPNQISGLTICGQMIFFD